MFKTTWTAEIPLARILPEIDFLFHERNFKNVVRGRGAAAKWGGWNTQAGHPHIPEALRQRRTLKQEEPFQARPGTLGFGLTQFIINLSLSHTHTRRGAHTNTIGGNTSALPANTSTHSATVGTGDV